ncbi:transcriptional repressor p66-alpha isoform X1 [Labeo rohita]|uniref:Transcriptional repressor p66-alpha isoform X1 n=1 Tax=Labeo rohita TaxID=84645 RepID=A0A498M9D7_LABRO|nr:uncharacterized protein si:ch211-113p18.3 [Labeo rohita]RXN14135.1 transcriptional repressor p66-alpha isoform X1 [Labeo rohita]
MSLRSSGTTCAVSGCYNNRRKLNLWLNQECYDHKPLTKAECPCPQWYTFYRMPNTEEDKRMWLRNLYLKKPPKNLYVCSFHFVDKRPTAENPYPTLWLGYYRPPEKKRRKLQRKEIGTVIKVEVKDEYEEVSIEDVTYHDAQIQDGSNTGRPK